MNEALERYHKNISDNWQLFKAALKDFQPTEEYLAKVVNFLESDDIDSFDADIKQAILSELFRMVYKGNAYTDLLMLSRYASRIHDKYGVSVRIEIGDKQMEVIG